MRPFRCNVIIEVIEGEGAEAIRDGVHVMAWLKGMAAVATVTIRDVLPAPPAGAKPRAPKPRRARAAQPPSGTGILPVGTQADASLICAACNQPFKRTEMRGKAPIFCKRVECKRARWAAAARKSNPPDKGARLHLIRDRAERLKAKRTRITQTE